MPEHVKKNIRSKPSPRKGTNGARAGVKVPSRAAPQRGAVAGGGPKKHDPQAQNALAVLEQFRLIFRSAKKHFQWVQERTGVGGAQLWALAELHRSPGLRVTELARAMAVHQTTASNLIERLVREKMIKRERSKFDQRVVNLRLTKKGSDAVRSAPLPLEGVLPDALKSLPRGDLLELQRRLDRLVKLMKVRDISGKRIPLAEM